MRGDCETLICILRTDYGLLMARIGDACGVSQQCIDAVYRGKRPGGFELGRSLEALYDACEDGRVRATRKPYTWQAGRDIWREGKQKSASIRAQLQPASMPQPAQSRRCGYCQSGESQEKPLRYFENVQGGTWLHQPCIGAYWGLKWKDGKKRAAASHHLIEMSPSGSPR